MKYSEFEREVEKLGFTHSTRCAEIVVKVHGRTVMGVSTNLEYIVDSEWDEFQSLHKKTQGELFDLAYQLAKTPLAEREEEKRYRLWLSAYGASDFDLYRTKGHGLGGTNLNVLKSVTDPLLIFTESEIAELDITGFEKVEVTP